MNSIVAPQRHHHSRGLEWRDSGDQKTAPSVDLDCPTGSAGNPREAGPLVGPAVPT
jgi:hypothetical protein